jgi:hypothetical protein
MEKARKLFTSRDDEELVHLVTTFGGDSWSTIAQSMAQGFTARQCRERWRNYLDPKLQHAPWTEQEDRRLFDEFHRIGTRWTVLASMFPGRTGNAVRNRLFLLLRKKDKQPEEPIAPPPVIKPEPATQPQQTFHDIFSLYDPTSLSEYGREDMYSMWFSG